MTLENKKSASKIIFVICLTVSLLSFLSLIFPAFLVEFSLSESIPQAGEIYSQATLARAVYKGGSAVSPFVGIRGRYEFTENWDINLIG